MEIISGTCAGKDQPVVITGKVNLTIYADIVMEVQLLLMGLVSLDLL